LQEQGFMGNRWTTLAAVAALVLITSSGFAQDAGEPARQPMPSQAIPIDASQLAAPDITESDRAARDAELKHWVEEFTAWQQWSAQWRGRRQPGLLTDFRARPQKPAPPAWLADQCVDVFDDEDRLAPACALLIEWRDDGLSAQIRQTRAVVTTRQEEPPHSLWWEHIHVDLLWPALQWQGSIYGVVGMHVTTTAAGRWQIFTAPGALLLNLPTRYGTRAWRVAANYGVGYRLLDFTLPGNRPAQLHVNLAKTWLLSDPADVIAGRSTDLVGFSITFKKSK
jgi:hypothetical protein